MKQKRKILFYNWASFDNPEHDGGGVTVYLSNLMKVLSQREDYACFFLSSGTKYTFDGKLRIVETQNLYSPAVRSFQILNAPVHAPAALQARDLEVYLEDTSMLELLESFWQQQGGFDVVHFHNLEGLSLPVLKLKELHKDTKFYLTLHNYMPFCPQVNLWTSKGTNCYLQPQFPNCSQCVDCPSAKIETVFGQFKSLLPDAWKKAPFYKYLKNAANRIRELSKAASSSADSVSCDIFSRYRSENLRYVNLYMDQVFAVSQRTAEIAVHMGFQAGKVCTSYIGTAAAEDLCPPTASPGPYVNVVYLGYARSDKGFDFLLNALETLPASVSEKIDLQLFARCKNTAAYDAYRRSLDKIADRFHSIRFSNGYSRSQQPAILKKAHLGIVPVMWEDNLPQVMIEMAAAGVPVLTSDLGGAKELVSDESFVFPAGDVAAFCEKLGQLVQSPEKRDHFWDKPVCLTTMTQHIQLLDAYYMR